MDNIIQGSEQWIACRLGKITASRIADLTAKTKTGYGASRANYMAELIIERLTGARQESFTNTAMAWGTATEPQARALYEFENNCTVIEVGFVEHPIIALCGASPDGLVGDDGLIEIKCPNSATHIETLLEKKAPEKYIKQMMWQMACTGRAWCDFMSFDPRLPANLQSFTIRVMRDDNYIAELGKEVILFIDELELKIKKLEGL